MGSHALNKLTMGTMVALREYEAAARAAHSHRLFEIKPILSYWPIPEMRGMNELMTDIMSEQ
jgi:hypothetical protein